MQRNVKSISRGNLLFLFFPSYYNHIHPSTTASHRSMSSHSQSPHPQIQPCKYRTGKTLGAGSYSVVKECVHADTGNFYAAKVINKKLMAGKEHMVSSCWRRKGLDVG